MPIIFDDDDCYDDDYYFIGSGRKNPISLKQRIRSLTNEFEYLFSLSNEL